MSKDLTVSNLCVKSWLNPTVIAMPDIIVFSIFPRVENDRISAVCFKGMSRNVIIISLNQSSHPGY